LQKIRHELLTVACDSRFRVATRCRQGKMEINARHPPAKILAFTAPPSWWQACEASDAALPRVFRCQGPSLAAR
jgi:hypothetical protein